MSDKAELQPVKLFSGFSKTDLEKEVNDYIKSFDEIKFNTKLAVSQSTNGGMCKIFILVEATTITDGE